MPEEVDVEISPYIIRQIAAVLPQPEEPRETRIIVTTRIGRNL